MSDRFDCASFNTLMIISTPFANRIGLYGSFVNQFLNLRSFVLCDIDSNGIESILPRLPLLEFIFMYNYNIFSFDFENASESCATLQELQLISIVFEHYACI